MDEIERKEILFADLLLTGDQFFSDKIDRHKTKVDNNCVGTVCDCFKSPAKYIHL